MSTGVHVYLSRAGPAYVNCSGRQAPLVPTPGSHSGQYTVQSETPVCAVGRGSLSCDIGDE